MVDGRSGMVCDFALFVYLIVMKWVYGDRGDSGHRPGGWR